MRWLLMVLTVVASASFGLSQTGGVKSDKDALQGDWRVISIEAGGKPLPAEVVKQSESSLTVKGDIMINKRKTIGEDPATFKLDPSKMPKEIDITPKKDGKSMKGIYELKGDELKMCIDSSGGPRPSEFKTKEGSALGILVYQRVKK